MNKNLRIVVATAVMLWCGLGMGTINASVMQSVFSPVGIENPAVDSVIISMDGINNNAVFDRVSLPNPDHPGAIEAITGEHSKPIHLELNPTETANFPDLVLSIFGCCLESFLNDVLELF